MDQRISFVTLAVSDLPRSHAFYVDGLGWTPELQKLVGGVQTGKGLIEAVQAEYEKELSR